MGDDKAKISGSNFAALPEVSSFLIKSCREHKFKIHKYIFSYFFIRIIKFHKPGRVLVRETALTLWRELS